MTPDTQLGHYEILSLLGKGGMGEVWKAKDTKLGREVAIKTLPPEFPDDPDRLARFERARRHRMKSSVSFAAVLYVALTVSTCGQAAEQQGEPSTTTEASLAAIRRVIDEFDAAMSAGDTDRWEAIHTDDIIIMRPNDVSAIGHEANRTILEGLFDQFTFSIDASTDETVVGGDWAFVRGTYTQTVFPKDGGAPTNIYGKRINILRRESDGAWKIARRIYNATPPPLEE